MKNRIQASWIVVLLCALVVSLTACGGGKKEEPAASSPAASGSAAPSESAPASGGAGKTITLQTLLKADGTSPREKAFAEIVKNFTAKTGINVKYVTLPWQEVDTQLMLSVQAGNPPDISFVRDRTFNKHIEANSLLQLDDFIKKDLKEEDLKDFILYDKSGMHDGKKFTFPTSFVANTVLYRKDLLDEKGLQPPKTWDEFVNVAKALNNGQMSGYMFGGSPVQPNHLDWMQSWIEGRGGKVLDENGKAVFDSPEGIESFQFLKSAIYDHQVTPKNIVTLKYDDVTEAFSSGRTAIIFEGSHRYSQVEKALGAGKVLSTYIPSPDASKPSPVVVSGWQIGIPRNSAQPNEAWEFIKFLTSAESVLTYAKISGEIPIRSSVTKDEYFQSESGKMTAWWLDAINKHGSLAVAPATISELNDIIASMVQAITNSPDSNVEEIVKKGVADYNKVVDSK